MYPSFLPLIHPFTHSCIHPSINMSIYSCIHPSINLLIHHSSIHSSINVHLSLSWRLTTRWRIQVVLYLLCCILICLSFGSLFYGKVNDKHIISQFNYVLHIYIYAYNVYQRSFHNLSKMFITFYYGTINSLLPAPFSYNYPSCSFFVYVKFQSITSLLSYSIIMY